MKVGTVYPTATATMQKFCDFLFSKLLRTWLSWRNWFQSSQYCPISGVSSSPSSTPPISQDTKIQILEAAIQVHIWTTLNVNHNFYRFLVDSSHLPHLQQLWTKSFSLECFPDAKLPYTQHHYRWSRGTHGFPWQAKKHSQQKRPWWLSFNLLLKRNICQGNERINAKWIVSIYTPPSTQQQQAWNMVWNMKHGFNKWSIELKSRITSSKTLCF